MADSFEKQQLVGAREEEIYASVFESVVAVVVVFQSVFHLEKHANNIFLFF
jgi:Cu/Ag efflux pump CusA